MLLFSELQTKRSTGLGASSFAAGHQQIAHSLFEMKS
jgi:hypothetical protein